MLSVKSHNNQWLNIIFYILFKAKTQHNQRSVQSVISFSELSEISGRNQWSISGQSVAVISDITL